MQLKKPNEIFIWREKKQKENVFVANYFDLVDCCFHCDVLFLLELVQMHLNQQNLVVVVVPDFHYFVERGFHFVGADCFVLDFDSSKSFEMSIIIYYYIESQNLHKQIW